MDLCVCVCVLSDAQKTQTCVTGRDSVQQANKTIVSTACAFFVPFSRTILHPWHDKRAGSDVRLMCRCNEYTEKGDDEILANQVTALYAACGQKSWFIQYTRILTPYLLVTQKQKNVVALFAFTYYYNIFNIFKYYISCIYVHAANNNIMYTQTASVACVLFTLKQHDMNTRRSHVWCISAFPSPRAARFCETTREFRRFRRHPRTGLTANAIGNNKNVSAVRVTL